MMENRYALIEDGVVVNIVVAYGAWPHGGTAINIDASPEVSIGWGYDGTNFIAPPPPPVLPPQSITMRQCRLHLMATGKLDLVQPAIDSMPEPARSAANIEWEYGAVVQRNAPLIAQLAPVLGWATPEEIDAQFIAASQL